MYVNETGYLEIERIRVKLNYFIPNFVFWEKTWILHANKCYVIIREKIIILCEKIIECEKLKI